MRGYCRLAGSAVMMLLTLANYSAISQEQPLRTVSVGNVGGHRVDFLLYPNGSSRCEADTGLRWGDGVYGRAGAEIHLHARSAPTLTYYISKRTWAMSSGAQQGGELRFSSGPAWRVQTRAVGPTILRIDAPAESFSHWRQATRATIALDSGFSATWDLAGTSAAGALLLQCFDAARGETRRDDPMRPRGGGTTNPMAPAGRDDVWVNKSN
jgi:hypothetical protein